MTLMTCLLIPHSVRADSPAMVQIPAGGAVVTRCADPVNAANPDCQLGGVRSITPAETLAGPGARTAGTNKSRVNKNMVSAPQPCMAQELTMCAGEVVVLNVGAMDCVAIGNGKVASSPAQPRDLGPLPTAHLLFTGRRYILRSPAPIPTLRRGHACSSHFIDPRHEHLFLDRSRPSACGRGSR